MSTVDLKKRLIEKIHKTRDEGLLEEVSRLLELEAENIDIYKLNEDQVKVISEARLQYGKGQFLLEDDANQEIDEWLNK